MRRFFKILFITISLILIILIIGLFGAHYWLSHKWKDFYTETEMKAIASEINSTELLPDSFYIAYDKIYPRQRTKTLNQMTFEAIWYTITFQQNKTLNFKQSNSIWISNFVNGKVPINYMSWRSYITAYGIEKYSSESKCLDASLQKIGIENYSIKYFSKPMKELNLNQNIELILRLENPTYYERNPNSLKEKIEKIKIIASP